VISRSDSSTTLSTVDYALSIKWHRFYRGSEREFSAAAFHRLCDNQGPTVVLVRAKNGRAAASYCCTAWKTSEGSIDLNPRGFLYRFERHFS
jgi:hypothetical protein